MKKLRIVVPILLAAALLGACGAQVPAFGSATPIPTTAPDQTPIPMPVATTPPDIAPSGTLGDEALADEAESSAALMITVRDGDTLERDIIPQIAAALDIPARYVEDACAEAQSELISDDTDGFRRMEGIIPPGEYDVSGMTVAECVTMWISDAEERYERIAGKGSNDNSLSAAERLTLGSIVEWETMLADRYEREVAAVFLNRLDADERLYSCATAEYALGYSRPYLTSDDIKVDSPYNTYVTNGLPPGPICAMDDESLAAATAKAKNSAVWFFFYDYALKKIVTFDDSEKFRAAADESQTRFDETFNIGRYDVVDKRAYFGG